MIYELFAVISAFIVNLISAWGYVGITFLMALESACIPIPSEIIMPFSGFLVWEGRFALLPVIFWGTMGNLIGSVIAYWVGLKGGRPFVEKYGKYILISKHDLDLSENWFKKYGGFSVFFSRMLPVVRTFISLPAGVARMPFWKFSIYTFFGSLPWSFFLTYYVGLIGGENWKSMEPYFRKFDWLIMILVGLFIGWWIYYKLKNKKQKL